MPGVTEAFLGGYVFVQHCAPSHTAKVTKQWCRTHMTDFCDKDMWPPSSPNLNPMDFAIWSILETDVCATPHSSTANLKRTLQTAWSNLDESAVRRSCLSALGRFEAVVKAKGGHIEWCYCRLDIHMFMNICTKNQLNIFANNRNIWKNRSVNLSAPPCIFKT